MHFEQNCSCEKNVITQILYSKLILFYFFSRQPCIGNSHDCEIDEIRQKKESASGPPNGNDNIEEEGIVRLFYYINILP